MSVEREDDQRTNTLPALAGPTGIDVVLANPVLHGELVDDTSTRQRVWRRRLVSWWQRSHGCRPRSRPAGTPRRRART